MEKSFEIGLRDLPPLPHFIFSISENIYEVWVEAESALHQPSISLSSQLFLSSTIKLKITTSTMEQSVPIHTVFSFKIIRIRNSQQKGKKRNKRNDDKKNQIQICLYQLYPIYKIKNSEK